VRFVEWDERLTTRLARLISGGIRVGVSQGRPGGQAQKGDERASGPPGGGRYAAGVFGPEGGV
jgi:hypothetical protein